MVSVNMAPALELARMDVTSWPDSRVSHREVLS